MDTKQCCRCGQIKPLEEFNFRYKERGILRKECRECTRYLSRRHFQKHPESYRERARARNQKLRLELRKILLDFLLSHPCVDCGETDILVLECDHVRGDKVADVPRMIGRPISRAAFEEELAKCEVRCANCHRRATIRRRGFHWSDRVKG